MKIAWATGLLAVVCAADLLSTIWLVMAGFAVEANPLLSFYLDNGVVCFVGAKILLSLGPLYTLELLRRRRPRFVRNLLCAGVGLYVICYGLSSWSLNAARSTAEPRNPKSFSAR